jgi:hypothetical protein
MSDQCRMTWTVVDNDAIKLPPGVELPDGAEVRFTIPDTQQAPPSFVERYAAYIGVASDLLSDLAANLAHYVHIHPKK